jgi:chromosome segregation ATPase
VGEKLHLFTEMLSNMREIARNNESVICADEEIARIKTNMDFVKRDIFQKRRLLDDNTSIMDELRRELRELDDELLQKDQRIAEMEDAVKCKDCELQDLEDLIMHKDRVIG